MEGLELVGIKVYSQLLHAAELLKYHCKNVTTMMDFKMKAKTKWNRDLMFRLGLHMTQTIYTTLGTKITS